MTPCPQATRKRGRASSISANRQSLQPPPIADSTMRAIRGNSPVMPSLHNRRRLGLPLGLQLLGIVVGALIVAQLVTLALTLFLPPTPVQRWDLAAVAKALLSDKDSAQFDRKRMAGPPDIGQPGWLVSASSRQALADKLGRPVGEVVLAFHTQLPVGGVTVPVNQLKSPLAAADTVGGFSGLSWLVGEAQAQSMPGGPPPGGLPGGLPGGGFPGGGFPGGGLPGGGLPGGAPPAGRFPSGLPGGGMPSGPIPGARIPGPPPQAGGPMAQAPNAQLPSAQAPAAQPPRQQPPGSVAPPQSTAPPTNPRPGNLPPPPGAPQMAAPGLSAVLAGQARTSAPGTPTSSAVALPAARAKASSPQPAASAPAIATWPAAVPLILPQSTPTAAVAQPYAAVAVGDGSVSPDAFRLPAGTPQAIPFRQPEGLLSFTTPPFIEGDFIAALRNPDGSWIALAPRAEPFPNRWQQRVMLWFALSLLIVAPLAWLFARRIVKPLERFARAAEMLGRDPATTVLPLTGPAEIGRAAQAFNQMNSRLRAFVDDRTAMVGAISHDLRTPLTRLRFRLEDVPDEQRDALLREVEDMEVMISQVIGFIRDASTPGPRERIDFAELVESSVADARMLGGEITMEASPNIPVDVDPIGMRRLLGNLLENAIKYGGLTRVRVLLRAGQAVAEIIDDGPGIPDDEREQVFEPFYRGETARGSGKPGSGLGLAVCRSIARAHGGEVSLEQREEGFVAAVSVPISYIDLLRIAA